MFGKYMLYKAMYLQAGVMVQIYNDDGSFPDKANNGFIEGKNVSPELIDSVAKTMMARVLDERTPRLLHPKVFADTASKVEASKMIIKDDEVREVTLDEISAHMDALALVGGDTLVLAEKRQQDGDLVQAKESIVVEPVVDTGGEGISESVGEIV
jgi:hypothetical protein